MLADEPMNQLGVYAAEMMKSERARTDPKLVEDFRTALEGNCIYIQNVMAEANDFSLLEALQSELLQHAMRSGGTESPPAELEADKAAAQGDRSPWSEAGVDGMVNWSKHLKHENPEFSPTFQSIVRRLEQHFDVETYATRLNVYRNGSDWKPFHHDSHAFHKGYSEREDFTMGVSLGATRSLEFLHPSGMKFGFPQSNGDIMAFTSVANKIFQHGVPKEPRAGLRISIISWGRRRFLTPRNSGRGEREAEVDRVASDVLPCQCGCRVKRNSPLRVVSQKKDDGKKKKSRIQGGVGKK